MISTYFGLDQLDSPQAMLAALLIGLAFGFVLERAGFGSSRKLAGIFYLRDMTVLKVMFTGVIAAMLGLSYMLAVGWVSADQVYAMPTLYASQIVGGLLFGVGFVVSGWCPGTAGVGVASGKLDALVFLGGAVLGSIGFNELYPAIQEVGLLPSADVVVESPVAFGLSRSVFAMVFTLIAVGAFFFAEWVERRANAAHASRRPLGGPVLRAMSVAMVAFAAVLLVLPTSNDAAMADGAGDTANLLAAVEAAEDHIEPEELADRLMQGEADLLVVDIRPANEFAAFHLRGAQNIAMPDLPAALAPHQNRGTIVLYSTGMTHPAQARDALAQSGYRNAYILTEGLEGFAERCLKPVSLRDPPLSPTEAARVNAWRSFFLGAAAPAAATASVAQPRPNAAQRAIPALVDTQWLADRLEAGDVKIIDLRAQPKYNSGHIPGAMSLNPESFRGMVDGIPSLLLPADMIARHLSLKGIRPGDAVILVTGSEPGDSTLGNSVRDATLVGMGFERVGHRDWAILEGGFAKWTAEERPVSTALPRVTASDYPTPEKPDGFTVDAQYVLGAIGDKGKAILDVRPADFFSGAKTDEARAGHVPGAVNRPFKDDLVKGSEGLQSIEALARAYDELLPKDAEVIVHCRTGHQASQAYFVLTRLLGRTNVKWYDAGWTEWAARPELPVSRE
jgi:thiosulfate/3-mercaptopyruvate sulfurtransferase